MFKFIRNIGAGNKWRKEIAGIPTYFAAATLALRYADSSVIGSFLVFLCFMVIYHYVYEFVFPKFESSKEFRKLVVFFVAQLAFWVIVFFLWFDIRKRVGL